MSHTASRLAAQAPAPMDHAELLEAIRLVAVIREAGQWPGFVEHLDAALSRYTARVIDDPWLRGGDEWSGAAELAGDIARLLDCPYGAALAAAREYLTGGSRRSITLQCLREHVARMSPERLDGPRPAREVRPAW